MVAVKRSTTLIWPVLALIAGALLVPAALGATRPDDRGGMSGVGAVAVATQVTHPNDAGGRLGVGAVAVTQAVQDAKAALVGAGDVSAASEPDAARGIAPAVPLSAATGIDWSSILAGVGIVVLAVVIAGAAVEVARDHGGRGRPVLH